MATVSPSCTVTCVLNERFEKVVLVHGVRVVSELAYADYIRDELPRHELLGGEIAGKLIYYPTVTREPFRNRGRLTDLIDGGRLFERTHDRALFVDHHRGDHHARFPVSPTMQLAAHGLWRQAGDASRSRPARYKSATWLAGRLPFRAAAHRRRRNA